jgi:hypothetical protein
MNKYLFLAILAVSLIPAFFSIGRGITGMAVGDTGGAASTAGGHFFSGVALIYFVASVVVLAIVASYLIELSIQEKKLKIAKKQPVKHLENFRSAFRDIKFAKGMKFSDISEEKAELYIVGIVGIVAIIGILIMVLR